MLHQFKRYQHLSPPVLSQAICCELYTWDRYGARYWNHCVRVLLGRYLLNVSTFWNQTWYCGVSSWASVVQNHSVAIFWVVVTLTAVNFWTNDSLATKLSWWLIIISQNVLSSIWLLCSGSRSQQRFAVSINVCRDEMNLLLPNLVWLCIDHHGLECHLKRLPFSTSRSHSQWGLIESKYYRFYYIFQTADPFATKLSSNTCSVWVAIVFVLVS